MEELKKQTIKDDNIALVDGFYRYVNHDDRICTTGFGTPEALKKYSGNIRFDNRTVELMTRRYENMQERP